MTQKQPSRRGGRGHAIVDEKVILQLMERYESGESLGNLSSEVGISKPGLSQRFKKIRDDPSLQIAALEAKIAALEDENEELKARLEPNQAGETKEAILVSLEEKDFQTFEQLAVSAQTTQKRVRACVYANPKLFAALKDRDGLVFVRRI